MFVEESDIYKKYRKKLKSIFDNNNQQVSREMLEEFENYLRDNWSMDNVKIYRYSNADYYNLRNFEKGKIRLTNNGILNDIFEGLPHGITAEQIKSICDIVYMKCFSTDYENTLMWAHYADNNKGICIEYDLSILEHDDPVLENVYPIIYEEKRPFKIDVQEIAEIVEKQKWLNYDIQQDGEDNYNALFQALPFFLFKSKDWEYEKEWRIIYTKAEIYLNDCVDVQNPIINFDCATGIYLGYRVEKEVKENIVEIVDRINEDRKQKSRECVSVYEPTLNRDTYGFKFHKIH